MSKMVATERALWRIGITQREQQATQGREACDALDNGYVRWLMRVLPDSIAIPIPNFDTPAIALAYADALNINALVLSGGGDLHTQPRRLAIEHALVGEARRLRWPLLGICRGMQVLQHLHGGDVIPIDGHVGAKHALVAPDAAPRAYEHESLGVTVNSWHQFGIRNVANGWQALACSVDQCVEAMRHTDLPWLGMMWHPERANGGEALCDAWITDAFKQPYPHA